MWAIQSLCLLKASPIVNGRYEIREAACQSCEYCDRDSCTHIPNITPLESKNNYVV